MYSDAPPPSTTAELLHSLRSAAAEMRTGGSMSSSRVAGGGSDGAAAAAPSLAATTHTNLLLQLSALHKGFLALSDALMEEAEAAAAQRQDVDARLDTLRRELGARLEVAGKLQQDLRSLADLDESLRQENGLLAERVQQLEAQVASLQAQVEQQEAVAAEHVQRQVTHAINSQLADHLQHFEEQRLADMVAAAVEQQAQRWAQERLPALLQEQAAQAAAAAVEMELQASLAKELSDLRSTVEAVAEMAAGAAADGAAMAADVRQLAQWCSQIAEAHDNHEQRLGRIEEDVLAASTAPVAAPSTPLPAPPQPQLVSQQQQQQQQDMQAQEERLRSLLTEAAAQQEQRQGAAEARIAELQGRVEFLAAQQAQQAGAANETAHSMLTDVAALARHTKALDGELRGLRRAVERTQQAVMDTSAELGKALGRPPPCGVFTSFPPDP